MKKILLLVVAMSFQNAFSQVSLSGNKLMKDGQSYKISEYNQVFTNPVATDYFKKGRSNKTAGDVISSIGGFGMGLSLGLLISTPKEQKVNTPMGSATATTDNSARWTVFGVSTGIALASIPFYLGAKKNFNKALETENGDSVTFQPYFKLQTIGNGIALSYHF